MGIAPRYVQLSKERVAEFKKLFEEEYGVKYTDEEAHEAAHNLVNFFYYSGK